MGVQSKYCIYYVNGGIVKLATDPEKNNTIPGALYAYDSLTEEKCVPEWDQLNEALKDPQVTNIAITAPYDTGKTSFLKSFFTHREVEKIREKSFSPFDEDELVQKARERIKKGKTTFRFINLPNFFEEVNDKKESEIELEKDIIGQLLFNSSPWKYPDSKIKRMRKYPLWLITIAYFVIITFIALLLWSNYAIEVKEYFDTNQLVRKATVIMGLFLGWVLFYFAVHYFSKIAWSISTKFGSTELGAKIEHSDNKNDKDLFLLYGDELKYYIYKNKLEYIIFEDLDRYNNPLIFQRLRELNQNLNIGKRKLVFIYTLKDSIFSKENIKSIDPNNEQKVNSDDKKLVNSPKLKTKFFDYIISLMPNSSIQNTRKDFEREINKYGILTKKDVLGTEDTGEKFKYKGEIKEKYLYGLGRFITDRREIINIVSETAAYAKKLEDRSISLDKLLGVIVYKNEFPDDFEKIPSRKSYLDQIMYYQSMIYDVEIIRETNNLNKETDLLKNKQLEIAKDDDINTISELIDNKIEELFGNEQFKYLYGRQRTRNELLDNDSDIRKQIVKDALSSDEDTDILDLDLADKLIISNNIDSTDNIDNVISNMINQRLSKIQQVRDDIKDNDYGQILEKILEEVVDAKSLKQIFELNPDYKKLDASAQDLLINSLIKINSSAVFRYLLFEDLLDSTFYEYISSSAYNVSFKDLNFIHDVLSRKVSEHDRDIDNVEVVEKELNAADANYRFAYSSKLLTYLTNSNENTTHIEDILRNAQQLKNMEVILAFIKNKTVSSQQFSLFINSLMKIWPEVFDMSSRHRFKNVSDVDFKLFIQKDIEYLFCSDNNKLFNILKDDEVLETSLAKDAFMSALENTHSSVLERANAYKFKNLSFASQNSDILFSLVKNKWYEENYENFCIIFRKRVKENFAKLVAIKDNLNLSNGYVLKEVFQYYQDNRNATFNDIEAIKTFLGTNFKSIDDEYWIQLLRVYLKSDENFDHDQKDKIITFTDLIRLIDNKIIDETLLTDLIEENKLVYKEDLFKVIYDNNENIATKYELKFENEDNISFFFYDRHWSFIMKYLIESKYQRQIVAMIDKDKDLSFLESECADEQRKIILKYTANEKVIRKIMQFTNLTSEIKGIIIQKIFSDEKFKMRFSKEEISNLIFDDPDYIETWYENINGRNEVSTPELRNKYREQFELLYDNVPQDFKKKGTNKFIFLKKFKSWLA